MKKLPVINHGDGIEHWTGQVSTADASTVIMAKCDGRWWHLYQAGDELPAEPTDQAAASPEAASAAVAGGVRL